MPIVGEHPESGLRIDIERPRDPSPPWRYEGRAFTPIESFRIVVTLSENGDVEVDALGAGGAIADRVRRIVRSAWRQAQKGHAPPPSRIARWRPEG
jgi:hypothetical protein